MIGSLEGRLSYKSPPHLQIEVAGVGYELEAPMSTFYGMPPVGESLRLLTHLVVREDAHALYGFATAAERSLFRNLLKVSGVGPRIALAILSGVSVTAFAQCVHEKNAAALTRIPGVGRKIADRLVIEMADRLGAELGAPPEMNGATVAGAHGAAAEAWSALVALGYKAPEATRLLKQAGEGGSTEELIRRALQSAARD